MKNSNKGFTLIEVIVSIAIIAVVSVSILTMFSTSSKVNRRAKEIDMANLLAVSEGEKIKRDPEAFIAQGSVVNTEHKKKHKDNDTTVKTVVVKKYYDYQWNEISDESNAVFTATSTIKKGETLGDLNMYRPKKNITSRNDIIRRTHQKNLIIAIDNPDPDFYNNDYETYILKGYTYDSFNKWLYDEESEDAFPKSWEKRVNRPGEFQVLKTRGHTTVTFYALRHYGGGNYDKGDDESRVLGSIPMFLEIEDSSQFDDYDIEVVNLTKKELDIYIVNKEKLKNEINFTMSEGMVNVTYISGEKKTELGYDINIRITRNKDNSELIDYSIEKYESK